MIKYLRKFPTTLDVELIYLLSNLWWLIVFTAPPGYFSGTLYDRATTFLGRDVLVYMLAMIVFIQISTLARREWAHVSLIIGAMSYLYLAVMSVIGTQIALNAGILFIVPLIGTYRLFSHTLYNENGTTTKTS